jgi:hypothetical protein
VAFPLEHGAQIDELDEDTVRRLLLYATRRCPGVENAVAAEVQHLAYGQVMLMPDETFYNWTALARANFSMEYSEAMSRPGRPDIPATRHLEVLNILFSEMVRRCQSGGNKLCSFNTKVNVINAMCEIVDMQQEAGGAFARHVRDGAHILAINVVAAARAFAPDRRLHVHKSWNIPIARLEKSSSDDPYSFSIAPAAGINEALRLLKEYARQDESGHA